MKPTRAALDAIDAARRDGRVTERAAGAIADAPPMTEEQFLRKVLLCAKANSWLVAHFRPARTKDGGWRTAVSGDGKGWPDLAMLRGQTFVVAELKTGKNKPTPEQLQWLDAFRAAGIEAYLWFPDDMPEIEVVLGA